MFYYLAKVIITTLLIVAISELSKRSSLIGAILASVPLVSVLAITWLYIDTKDLTKITELSTAIFWLVLPSLVFFIVLPLLIKLELNFYLAMTIAIIVTICCYFVMLAVLNYFNIKL